VLPIVPSANTNASPSILLLLLAAFAEANFHCWVHNNTYQTNFSLLG